MTRLRVLTVCPNLQNVRNKSRDSADCDELEQDSQFPLVQLVPIAGGGLTEVVSGGSQRKDQQPQPWTHYHHLHGQLDQEMSRNDVTW